MSPVGPLWKGQTSEYKAGNRHQQTIFGLFVFRPGGLETQLKDFKSQKQGTAGQRTQDLLIPCRGMGRGSGELTVFTTETCSSSMDLAWNLVAQKRFPEWTSVLAATQSAGRGQFKRLWYSPSGNVYGSLRMPPLGPLWGDLLPLLLAESLHVILIGFGLTPAIKWPNDLLVGGKKTGGILVEARSGIIIAGLGLNLISAPALPEIRQPLALQAGCLQEFGLAPDPLEIWVAFVREVRSRVEKIRLQGDPQRFLDRLIPRLAYIGERILIDTRDAAEQPAIFEGLAASGGIKVLTSQGKRVFHSGSIYPVI